MKYEFIEEIKDNIAKCVMCASCHANCPTYELSRSETLNARGKIRLARGLLTGEIGLTDRVVNDFDECLSCMNCRTACPSGVDTMAVISAVRHEVHERRGVGMVARFIFSYILAHPWRLNLLAKIVGILSLFYTAAPRWLARFLPFANKGVKRVNPDFLKKNLRSSLSDIEPSGEERGTPLKRVAFFSGCMTDLAFPETGLKVIEGLKSAGVEVIYPKGQVCCGAPAYFAGDFTTTKELAKKNLEAFVNVDVDAIVYSCATCGSVLGEIYRELFPGDQQIRKMALKVVDFQKLVIDMSIESIFSAQENTRKLKVTYHDPCHLKRGMGVDKEPRRLLKSLPHVEFVEMEGADACCGGAGTFSMKFYDSSMGQGRRKVEWIKKSGADILVTACPSCQLQLTDSLNRFGHPIPVLHTADLIDYAFSGRRTTTDRK